LKLALQKMDTTNDLYMVSIPLSEKLIYKSSNIYIVIVALCVLIVILLSISLATFKRTLRTIAFTVSIPVLVLFVWVYQIQASRDWASTAEETTIYPYNQSDEVPYVPVSFR